MKNNLTFQGAGFIACILLLTGSFQQAVSQIETRWLKVGELQAPFVDHGTENELQPAGSNVVSWPAQYGDNQHTSRQKHIWLGAKNFYDPVEKKVKAYKVVGSGPRWDASINRTMIFSKKIKLVGKYQHPTVIVDNSLASGIQQYDVLDEEQSDLECDRMVVSTFNTSIGVSVTKKVMAFTQPNHDNYFIYDWVFKNTGIYNENGDTIQQTLNDFWVHFGYRHAFAGVTSTGWGSTWGAFSSEWGASTVSHDFGPFRTPTADTLRGFYSFYAPHEDRTFPLKSSLSAYDLDWGCPNQNGGGSTINGILGAAKYAGVATLFASQSPQNYGVDDIDQPRTTSYASADDDITYNTVNQYDDVLMQKRYTRMSEGHLPQSLEEAIGNEYVGDWWARQTERQNGTQGQGFGPYQLEFGDSIRIVFVEAVDGISWEKCREVGNVWYQYYTSNSSPPLIMPNGVARTDSNFIEYTKAWVFTGKDSIYKSFRNARANFRSGFNIPQAPPAPGRFTVTSGGDRILLEWADNAAGDPHFDGYVIWRSEGTVKDYRTVYTKVFECNRGNVVHSWADTSAVRGFKYYYSIQSKDDGSQTDVDGVSRVLYSSMFLTMTSSDKPAYLLRPAGNLLGEVRVVPNPFDIRSRKFQFSDATGTANLDQIMFYGIPGKCKLKIYTENGTLIREINHTNGSGDERWDSKTSSGQVVASGIYILYVEVTEDIYATEDKIARYDITNEKLETMYPAGSAVYKNGDKIFSAGQSTFRKFVIIR